MEDLRYKSAAEFLKSDDSKKPGELSTNLTFTGPTGKTPTIKTIDFFMGGQDGGQVGKKNNYSKRTDWRHINRNNIDFSGDNCVNKNVLLIPSDMTLQVSGGLELEQVNETLGGAQSFMDFLTKANEIIDGTSFVAAWQSKTFKDLKPLTIGPTDFEFKFQFGNAGLYNSFEEVVKPIVALMLFFGVDSGNGGIMSSSVAITPPYPTKAQYLMQQVKGIVGTIGDAYQSAQSNANNENADLATSAKSALASINSTVQSALSSAARSVALDSKHNNLYFSWGRFVVGPLIYENYSYSFDMSNLDEWGWPTSGTFKLSNMSSMRKSSTQAMLSPFIQGM